MSETLYETFDLLGASRAPQLRSLLMESLSDRFMRQIAFALFQRMRHKVQLLSCINGVLTHDDAINAMPDIILGGVADLAPLRGRMLVVIDGDLIGAVVDGMCGATKSDSAPRNDLSAMETRIGKQMIDLTFATIAEVLNNLLPLNLTPLMYDTATAMLAISEGQDWTISVTGIFETALGFGSIKILAPYAGLEPLEAKVTSQAGLIGPREADQRWVNALCGLTDATPVEIRFELARQPIAIGLFETMRLGDVLPFPLLPHAIAVAGGTDLWHADFGQNDGFICCRPIAIGVAAGDAADGGPEHGGAAAADRNGPAAPVLAAPGPPETSWKSMVEHVKVLLTIELGSTRLSVDELRRLRIGQVILLDQMAGAPFAILINGQRLAWGQPVMLGPNRYGLRLTALEHPATTGKHPAELAAV